ncbi:hypothetical protein KY343_06260 [Candidatus Woesearchaeota archaeon]|nr:hypothetical protein [Candidatus Woesearchaeota archaeon]
MVFGWIGKLLSALFGKKETKIKKKPVHEKVQDSYFIKVQGHLLRLRNRLGSIKDERGIRESRRELEKLRREFWHINKQQQRYLSGIFKQCEVGIANLERKFKQMKRREQQKAV